MPSIKLLSWPSTVISVKLWPNWVTVSSKISTPAPIPTVPIVATFFAIAFFTPS